MLNDTKMGLNRLAYNKARTVTASYIYFPTTEMPLIRIYSTICV
jgi:hypothetical protein